MFFKSLLLTPLLFIQMWFGFGIVHNSIIVDETASSLTIDLTIEITKSQIVKIPEKIKIDLISIYLTSLLICVSCFSLRKDKFHNVKRDVSFLVKDINNSLFKRVVSKTKSAYYSNFHSFINSLKSV